MKLTPNYLRQVIKEELSAVIFEDTQSLEQPPDALLDWVPDPSHRSKYQRLYHTGQNAWIDDPKQHGMLTKQGRTEAPIVVFTAKVKDDPAGPRWRVWATGGNFPDDTSAHSVWGSVAGKIHRLAGRDSLMKENLPVEGLQQAIDAIEAKIKDTLK